MILGPSIHKEQILGTPCRQTHSLIMEKLLELRREYLQEVVARRGGQAGEDLEEVAIATSRDLERVWSINNVASWYFVDVYLLIKVVCGSFLVGNLFS